MKLETQEIMPRHSVAGTWGSDWGAPRPVLARRGTKVLFVWPGREVREERGKFPYVQAKVCLFWPDEKLQFVCRTKTLWTGRFNLQKLREHATEIAEFFNVSVDDVMQIRRNTTLLFE